MPRCNKRSRGPWPLCFPRAINKSFPSREKRKGKGEGKGEGKEGKEGKKGEEGEEGKEGEEGEEEGGRVMIPSSAVLRWFTLWITT